MKNPADKKTARKSGQSNDGGDNTSPPDRAYSVDRKTYEQNLDLNAALQIADESPDLAAEAATVGIKNEEREVSFGVKEAPEQYRIDIDANKKPMAKAVKGSFSESREFEPTRKNSDIYKELEQQRLEKQKAKEKADKEAQELQEKKPATKAQLKARKRRLGKSKKEEAFGLYANDEAADIVAENEALLRQGTLDKRRRIIIFITMIAVVLILLLVFAISAMVSIQSGFTINILGAKPTEAGLTLYDNMSLTNSTARLDATDFPDCQDETYSDIYQEVLQIDRSAGTLSQAKRYFGYSFFVQNASTVTLDYQMTVKVVSSSAKVLDAVRVLIVDDSTYYGAVTNVRTVRSYGLPQVAADGTWVTDENGNYVMQKLLDASGNVMPDSMQDNAIPFVSNEICYRKTVRGLSPKSGENLHKYTVVIYLEGGDPDCDNHIKGGKIKFGIDYQVVQ